MQTVPISRIQSLLTRHRWLRWAVLSIGLAGALVAAHFVDAEVRRENRARFQASVVDKMNNVERRVRAYGDVLYALRGLFDASTTVTRDDFHEFTTALSVGERYPGLTNLSYSFRVPHEQKREFEERVRADPSPLLKGLPEFSIKPPGQRSEYTVLTYVEPMGKNVAAWGLDLMVDPARRSIVERARDTGQLASGSGIRLVRDAQSNMTSALFRLAVYRGGGVPDSLEERRRRYAGVVGSTLRVGEMMEAALSKETLAHMRVRIVLTTRGMGGAEKALNGWLLYDSQSDGTETRNEKGLRSSDYSAYVIKQRMAVGDQEWQIEVTPFMVPADWYDRYVPPAIMAIIVAISVLLFWLFSSLSTLGLQTVELAQRNSEAAMLAKFAEHVHSSASPGEIFEAVSRHMPEILPDSAGALYAFEAPQASMAAAVRWGTPIALEDELDLRDCAAMASGIQPYAADARIVSACPRFPPDAPACCACTPLVAQGATIGMLHAQRRSASSPAPRFSDTDIYLIKSVAQHIALAIADLRLREELTEHATRDTLTGLYNRRFMQAWLEQELHRARRARHALGVVMLDIDHFKRINDSYGHDAGDVVLREVAGVLHRIARKSDIVCRHGGEEFLLLMPESGLAGTLNKAEELRREVSQMALTHEGRELGPITISLGVAVFPGHAQDAQVLLRHADAALYAAKQGGRNRSVVAHPAELDLAHAA